MKTNFYSQLRKNIILISQSFKNYYDKKISSSKAIIIDMPNLVEKL